jgi:hypothetical protein
VRKILFQQIRYLLFMGLFVHERVFGLEGVVAAHIPGERFENLFGAAVDVPAAIKRPGTLDPASRADSALRTPTRSEIAFHLFFRTLEKFHHPFISFTGEGSEFADEFYKKFASAPLGCLLQRACERVVKNSLGGAGPPGTL